MTAQKSHNDLDGDLRAARTDIDAVDDEIHRLLIRREQAVRKITAAKGLQNGGGQADGNPVRFAREARIMRRLFANHKDNASHLPFIAVARIWHELIAAYTLLQNDYSIAITDEALRDLARRQFGDLVRIDKADFAPDNKQGKILWVVPHPKKSDIWLKLASADNFKITAALPLVHEEEDSAAPLAYVIGTCPQDFSSADGREDVLCLKLHCTTKADLQDKVMVDAMAAHDICAIATNGDYFYCERHAALPNGDGLSSGAWEKQLTVWQKELKGIEKIEWLGTYAKALSIG